MAPGSTPDRDNEEFWRDFLTRGHAMERRVRGVLRRLPHGPRCQMCAAPKQLTTEVVSLIIGPSG